jgi:nitrate reductase gamma subunit
MPTDAQSSRLCRRHGVGLILNGGALAMIASYVVINVVVRLALTPAGVWLAYVAQESSFEFPNTTVILVSTIVIIVALALLIAGRAITARVHYVSTRPERGSQPGVPPA